jgi:glycosyltransferase involved in cell wall biosynthesis
MRILVDGISLSAEMKGVGLYVANSILQISTVDPALKLIVLVLDNFPSHCLPKKPNIKYVTLQWKNHAWHGFITLPLLVRQFNPDIVWIPYETPVAFLNRPFAMLCHDIPEKIISAQLYRHRRSLTKYFTDKIDRILLRHTVRKAKIVFANSKFVANWLEKEEKVNPNNIRIAPCAPGADFRKMSQEIDREAVWKKLGMPQGYILAFYTGDPRENIEVVPEIYNSIVNVGLPCGLVIAGVRKGDQPYINQIFSNFQWRDQVRIIPFLGLEKIMELTEIFTAALVYLEPSLHEGFGMQVVEAMACGTPIVCSNRGALPEVAADAAYMVDPLDVEAMALGLIRVLSDPDLNHTLVRRGYERASEFSWKKTAQIIYRGLMEAGGKVKSNLHG